MLLNTSFIEDQGELSIDHFLIRFFDRFVQLLMNNNRKKETESLHLTNVFMNFPTQKKIVSSSKT